MPETVSLVKGLAVGSSLWAGGAMSAVSLLAVPALLSAPHNIAAKQFRLMHARSYMMRATILTVAALHSLAAYQVRGESNGTSSMWTRWATSAALMAAAIPWSLGVMDPVNSQLLAIAGTGDKREGGTEVGDKTEGLLRSWSGLNAVRAGLTVGAGLVGLWTLLEGY